MKQIFIIHEINEQCRRSQTLPGKDGKGKDSKDGGKAAGKDGKGPGEGAKSIVKL